MKLIKLSLLLVGLFVAGSVGVLAQDGGRITDPYDDSLVGEITDGWKVSCAYGTYNKRNQLNYVQCPYVRMNEGSYYATGWVYRSNGNLRELVKRKGNVTGVSLNFQKTDKDDKNLKKLEVVSMSPAVNKERDWNFYYSGTGGGGEESNIWGQSIEFRCKPCETGTYNSKLTFKDTVTNRIFSIDFSITVMPVPE